MTKETIVDDRSKVVWNGRLYQVWVSGRMVGFEIELADAMEMAKKHSLFDRQKEEGK